MGALANSKKFLRHDIVKGILMEPFRPISMPRAASSRQAVWTFSMAPDRSLDCADLRNHLAHSSRLDAKISVGVSPSGRRFWIFRRTTVRFFDSNELLSSVRSQKNKKTFGCSSDAEATPFRRSFRMHQHRLRYRCSDDHRKFTGQNHQKCSRWFWIFRWREVESEKNGEWLKSVRQIFCAITKSFCWFSLL